MPPRFRFAPARTTARYAAWSSYNNYYQDRTSKRLLSDPADNSDLVTMASLKRKFRNKPYHMVIIYSPQCIHCQNMISTLGDKFAEYDIISFYADDEVDDNFKDYYPHVYVFRNGQPVDSSVDELYDLLEIDTNNRNGRQTGRF